MARRLSRTRHNLQQVWQTADRILVMHLGRVAGIRRRADSSVDEIVKLIVYGADDETAALEGI